MERIFLKYKSMLRDNRRSFKFENLKSHFVTSCWYNSFPSSRVIRRYLRLLYLLRHSFVESQRNKYAEKHLIKMTKLFAIVCCVVIVTMTTVQSAPAKYTDKYDNVNIDEILKNDRLVNNYFKCLMETGKCTPEGEEIKKWLPEAIENKCADCTDKQKEGAEKIIKFLYEKKNDLWKELEAKYDPQGKFRELYKEEAKKLNIEK